MAAWKKGNFGDMDGREFGAVKGVFARKELESRELGVSRFSYPPNERFPFAHRHGEQEEAYVVVSGSGRMKLGDDIVELSKWDVLRVDPRSAARSSPAPTASRSSASAATAPMVATASRSRTSGTEPARSRLGLRQRTLIVSDLTASQSVSLSAGALA